MVENLEKRLEATLSTRGGSRRGLDLILPDLVNTWGTAQKVGEALNKVLASLVQLGYDGARVYRYDQRYQDYELVKASGSTKQFTKPGLRFRRSNPILDKLENLARGGERVLIEENILPEQIDGRNDPLRHLKEKAKGKKIGLAAILYEIPSEVYDRIRGVLIADFDPEKKKIDDYEKNVLRNLGVLTGFVVQQILERNAYRDRDGFTRLYNKSRFHRDLANLLKVSRREDSHYLMTLDCDGFKKLNDAHGHPAGDKFILSFSSYLRSLMDKNTTSYRTGGGDEFALVLRSTSLAQAGVLADEITEKIKTIPVPSGFRPIRVSIGLVGAQGGFEDSEFWYKKADEALYNAKELKYDPKIYYGGYLFK